ncbi:deoxyuridine-triphosphate nucleotidohydrolase [Rothia aeria]|uniref:Deoxyuridine-triphosphate nucleotidohydrolase n=1 Tax=Rothia aeria TaxID=172042 RepID=A0A2Z5R1T4_9MICC|nr:deoxyuridine-triphosphate nucleotidohydrolase [Rothia aeria]
MINPINVQIKMLDPELPAPAYTKPGDAGADLRSRVDFTLNPGERALVPTGLALALPEGTWVWCIRAPGWPLNTASPL